MNVSVRLMPAHDTNKDQNVCLPFSAAVLVGEIRLLSRIRLLGDAEASGNSRQTHRCVNGMEQPHASSSSSSLSSTSSSSSGIIKRNHTVRKTTLVWRKRNIKCTENLNHEGRWYLQQPLVAQYGNYDITAEKWNWLHKLVEFKDTTNSALHTCHWVFLINFNSSVSSFFSSSFFSLIK